MAISGRQKKDGIFISIGAGGAHYLRILVPTIQGGAHSPSIAHRSCGSPENVAITSADEVLDEMRRKSRTTSLAPPMGIISSILLLLGMSTFTHNELQPLAYLAIGMGATGFISLPWLNWRDQRVKTVRVHYSLDALGENVQRGIESVINVLNQTHRVWWIRSEWAVNSPKYNAGATSNIDRVSARVGFGTPPGIRTNVQVGYIDVAGQRLYLFPDRVLAWSSANVASIRYEELMASHGAIRFIEHSPPPADATIVGETWQYVNKNGSPDLRFKQNYRLPVVLYGLLRLEASNLRFELQTSASDVAGGVSQMLGLVARASARIRESPGSLRPKLSTEDLSDLFFEEPPPLAFLGPPISAAIGGLVRMASMRWVIGLPELVQPLVWGLALAVPGIAVTIRLARGPDIMPGLLLGLILVVSGHGLFAMVSAYVSIGKSRNAVVEDDREELASTADPTSEHGESSRPDRLTSFRNLVVNEFRKRPAQQVDIAEIAKVHGISSRERSRIAIEIFGWAAEKVVSDGVVTPKERRQLDVLATALGIDFDRAEGMLSRAWAKRPRNEP